MNIEKLVAAYLRATPAVEAFVGRRVVTKTPDSRTEPWIRLTMLDAPQDSNSQHDHLREFYLQFDCYAGAGTAEEGTGGQPQAVALAEAVRGAITAIDQGTHEGATISAGRIRGSARIPDIDLEPARERVILTASVWAH